MNTTPNINEIADKEAVRELRLRFGHYIDKRDFDMLPSLFTEEIDVDLSQIGGPARRMGRSEFIELFRHAFRNSNVRTQQNYSTVIVEVTGNHAKCWSYLHGWHFLQNSDGGSTWEIRAEYFDLAIKSGETWQICGTQLNVISTTGNAELVS